MKTFRRWLTGLVVLAVIGGGVWAWWNFDLRWRPHKITKHQGEITKLLEQSGWVSPGLQGPKLYMISFRSCPDCILFVTEQFPKLHTAGVDTREIMVARADADGMAHSTPAERATVAELWVNRRWSLLQAWYAIPPDAWKAPGVAPADGDTGRTAVVEASRKTVTDLKPLLKDNGINFAYPLLVWWTRDGEMHGCACERRETHRFVLTELGA